MQNQGKSYADSLLALAKQHQNELQQELINGQTQAFKDMSRASRQSQTEIEALDNMSFDEYLAEYFTRP
jgi:gamma-glutamylcysteine synthetase